MNDNNQSTEDLAILEQLNRDYVHSNQFNNVKRFSESSLKTSSCRLRASRETVKSSWTTSLSRVPSRTSLCTTSTSMSSVTLL